MKATKNWDWNSGIYIFISLQFFFHFFQDYAFFLLKIMQSKQRQIWNYYHLPSEDQNEKNT